MKKFLISFAFLLCAGLCFAGTKKTLLKTTSDIMNPANWSPSGVPQSGDTIVIPSGKQMQIAMSFSFPFGVHLRIYGEMKLTGSPINLYLDNASTIIVYHNAKLTGLNSNQKIFLNNLQIFSGATAVNGSKWATVSTNGFTPYDPLPVKFLGFSASLKNKDVLVQWSTTEEVNASIFELERSFDAANWTTIAYIAAAGTTSATTNYSFTDKNINTGTVYYRVKQVDMDGRFTFTPVRSIKPGATQKAEVSIASMGQSKVLLQFPKEVSGTVVVRFTAPNGQLLAQQTLNRPFGQVVLNTTASLKGNYIISLTNGQDLNVAGKVIL